MIKKGRGISAVMHPTGFKGGGDPDQATIRLKADGSIDLLVGAVDYGQGAKTVLRQFAAEALDVPIEKIVIHNSRTDNMPFSTDTAASRVTFIAGNAVLDAAGDFKESVLNFASDMLNIPKEELRLEGDKVFKSDGDEELTDFAVLGAASNWGGGFIVGNGAYLHCPGQPIEPETGAVDFAAAMAYAVCIVDVEVDDETGYVDIKRVTQAYEVGKCINPLLSEGQIDGGTMMGIGMAMSEDLYPKYPSINMSVDNFTDYIIPTSADIPVMDSVIVEVPDINGPYGAKGFGEMSSNPQPPAIVNAIYDAVGVRIDDLPATPEKILSAIESRK